MIEVKLYFHVVDQQVLVGQWAGHDISDKNL
jgi:hypothetical protein